MKHTIIFKDSKYYASFPLLQHTDNKLIIGYFKAPMVDHMGVFEWKILKSMDQGEIWDDLNQWKSLGKSKDGMASSGVLHMQDHPYNWPAVSPREQSDRFTTTLPNGTEIATGSFGFRTVTEYKSCGKEPVLIKISSRKLIKSNYLFLRSSSDGWRTIEERTWEIPNADVVLAFPRHLQAGELILVPIYVVSKLKFSRCLAWRSEDYGENFRLYDMFPVEVNGNEISFILTEKGILAHIRSDTNPYIMESWSEDRGKTWTYPTNIYGYKHDKDVNGGSVAGGPAHLLRLRDGRILCSYGYRFRPMGIRAIVSEDEGSTWGPPIILREDGGYLSGLHKRRWAYRFRLPNPGNDLGYPTSIELSDGVVLTAYYFTGSDKITCIATTKWRLK